MEVWTYLSIIEFAVLAVIGFSSFGLAIWMQHAPKLQSLWYKALKYILVFLAIAAVSDAWSTILIEHDATRPVEVMLSLSVLALITWMSCYCRFKLFKHCGEPFTLAKFLSLLQKEIAE